MCKRNISILTIPYLFFYCTTRRFPDGTPERSPISAYRIAPSSLMPSRSCTWQERLGISLSSRLVCNQYNSHDRRFSHYSAICCSSIRYAILYVRLLAHTCRVCDERYEGKKEARTFDTRQLKSANANPIGQTIVRCRLLISRFIVSSSSARTRLSVIAEFSPQSDHVCDLSRWSEWKKERERVLTNDEFLAIARWRGWF